MKRTGTDPAVRGVLWDMDGVIADTNDLHFESWRKVLPEYDLQMTEYDHKKTFGMNNRKILAISVGEEPGTELLRVELLLTRILCSSCAPLLGVVPQDLKTSWRQQKGMSVK
ncbi:MAG: HAD hydrolase-like protein [Anaerolineales bacterium]|nr:HAD hydrolase-like protein [Anaerolineales bacterium]